MSKDVKLTIDIGPALLGAIKATLKANQKWNQTIVPYDLISSKCQSPGSAIKEAFGIDITKLQ